MQQREDVMSNAQRGAEVLLELLRTNGIECVFASPIAVMAPLWEALAGRRERGDPEVPRYIQCRHETLAVGAAAGYYKATGRAQAVFLPTGLGVLHGAMALRTALLERTPMAVLSPDTLTYGEVAALDPGPEWPSLLIDFNGPARDGELCVKWAREAKTPGDLVNELRRALYLCEAVPRGPTLLAVPFDLLMSPVALEPGARIEPRPVVATAEQLDEVAALLRGAADPLIITDYGGRSAAERAALTALAEALAAPVFEFMQPSHHNVPRTHPLSMLGPVEPVLERADVILIAGSNAPWHPPHQRLRTDCAVIHLEEDPLRPRAAYWGYRTTHAVAGEREPSVRGIAERVRRRLPMPPADRARRWKQYKDRVLAQGAKDADTALTQVEGAVPAATLFRALHRALPASS